MRPASLLLGLALLGSAVPPKAIAALAIARRI